MTILSIVLVVCSGLMNAVWNLYAKSSKHKDVFLALIMSGAAVGLLPHLVWELSQRPLPFQAYLFLLLSMSIQAGYAFLLSRAYRIGELSQLYPIMRGTGVVLVPLAGVLALGERMTAAGWLGVACIAVGLAVSGFRKFGFGSTGYRPVFWAVGVGLCIASYTMIDKVTLQYVSPVSLLQVSSLGFMLAHSRRLFDRAVVREEWRLNRKSIVLGAMLSPGSYLLFLFAMDMAPVSYLAPMREVGTVFAALLGVLVLKEKQGRLRMAAAVAITTGIVVIGVSG